MTFEHEAIWLQPWCDDCEKNTGREGRSWCQDDVWGKCKECDKKSVKYVIEILPETFPGIGRRGTG